MGLMLRRFARKLSASGLEVDSALTDRQTARGHKSRVAKKRKKTGKDLAKNGKIERANKENRVIKGAGKVR